MLKSKQYAKWAVDKGDPDWGALKATEDERRASLRDTKKVDEFIELLKKNARRIESRENE